MTCSASAVLDNMEMVVWLFHKAGGYSLLILGGLKEKEREREMSNRKFPIVASYISQDASNVDRSCAWGSQYKDY